MLHLRPSAHAPSPLFRRLPLALGATAAALALAGCSYLPESLGGTAEGNGSEEGTDNPEGAEQTDGDAPHDPTNAEASIRTAVEHIETASDYDVLIFLNHESGDPLRGRTASHGYTNSPEEIVHTRLSGDGALNIVYFTNAEHTLRKSGDDLFQVVADPTPADEFNADPAVGAANLTQILETSTDLTYSGEGETEVDYTESSPEGDREHIQESIPAHSYSGTFTVTISEIAPESSPSPVEQVEYPDAPFTLWLDDEGVPVTLEYTNGDYDYQHIFKAVNEGLELPMPAPGDLSYM